MTFATGKKMTFEEFIQFDDGIGIDNLHKFENGELIVMPVGEVLER